MTVTRLYVFAEGQTEQTFADNLLKPHLANHNVFMHKPILIAHARKKGRVHRGGGRKYVPMRDDIIRFLKQDKDSKVFFTTMIDLYAIPDDFPELAESESYKSDPFKRVEFLEKKFTEDISKDISAERFLPYIQLHEYEAYLFSDPTYFKHLSVDNPTGIKELQLISQQYTTPELIDDGLETAPSKRIIQHFPNYKRGKTTIGVQIAEKIGLQTIRSHCKHFDQWLSKLESLGVASRL